MKNYICIILLLVCCLDYLSYSWADDKNGVNYIVTAKDRLVRDLTSNQPTAMPFVPNQTVRVSIMFFLLNILRLDALEQVLTIDATLTMVWHDLHLTWNSSYYENLTEISLPATDIWTPKLAFTTSVGSVWDDSWQRLFEVKVFNSGDVEWSIKSLFHISCDLDMRLFPFDSQKCIIEIMPMVHTADILDLVLPVWGGISIDDVYKNKEFELVEYAQNCSTHEPFEGEVFSMVQFTLKLKRKPAFYVMTLLVPSLLLSLLTILVFMVPADAGEKVSLAISLLLSFSVFLIVLSDNIPQVSDKAPILGFYLTIVICINGLALVCTVFVLNFYHTDPVRSMPPWIHKTIIIGLGTITGIRRISRRILPLQQQQQQENQQQVRPQQDQQQQQQIDRQSQGEYSDERNNGNGNHSGNEIGDGYSNIQIAQDVHQILARMQDGEEDDEIRDMWRLASRVLDRFFLMIFLAAMILGAAMGLAGYYLMHNS